MWQKILASKILQKNDIVQEVECKRKPPRIKVKYRTNIEEVFICDGRLQKHRPTKYFSVSKETAQLAYDIPIIEQYPPKPFDDEGHKAKYHHIIHRSDWIASSVIEQRIAYHRLLKKLMDNKDVEDYYPKNQRMPDINALKRDTPERYLHNNKFYMYPAGTNINTPWRRLIEHYFQVTPKLDDELLRKALNETIYKKLIDISSYEVRKRASILERGSRAYNPVAYQAILKRLGAVDSIIDLHPDLGHKAIACALMRMKYICLKTEKFQDAIKRSLVSDLGLNHEWLEDQKAHTIVSDNNFYGFDIAKAIKIADRAKLLIAFAGNSNRNELSNKFNPSQTHLLVRSRRKPPDYLFVW